jgi:hypothetical protein
MLVHCHRERQRGAIVANDVDGVFGCVPARHDAMEIDQGSPFALRRTEADIIGVVGIWSVLRAAVPIAEQSILSEGIVVRSLSTLAGGDGRNAERQAAKPWPEDALWAKQWNALAFEGETSSEDAARDQVEAKPALLVEKRERSKPNPQV